MAELDTTLIEPYEKNVDLNNEMIKSWLIPSLIATSCCCPPIGAIGLIFSAKTNCLIEKGDLQKAKKYSYYAKVLCLISLISMLILVISYIIIGIQTDFGKIAIF
ncbi:MAG: CD225/dispanin family protein [Candidatus Delongbacteria bacterium]|nr:CD225/dispanin family protein [Candidatus Delongbacteria bacterium]MBN2835436.1 CD225/dispanin family protein [Candidatus Delongbacteria bacterium]